MQQPPSPWNDLSTEADWQTFLTMWSELLVRDPKVLGKVPEPDRASRWLGEIGATEEQLSVVEDRLGLSLPPSYRLFLKVSNGWRYLRTGASLNALRPAYRLAWFVEENREWVDTHLEFFEPDEPEQQLASTLQISDVADSAVLLLNPRAIDAHGEWEGWFFATWAAGINPLPSFKALMQWMYHGDQLEAQR
jgi:hypothetical protein